jgi:DNA helicase-2/ATP-dependent DNA helicase PcrA
MEYKKMRWRKGHIHHDDVLFFSFQIIKKFPLVLKVLRAKFPYFFIDEFQDTTPIQTSIIKKLAEEETIVGVIGDNAQSIYGFQGAKPSQFTNFFLNGLVQYKIADNHRSTNQIVSLLNLVRPDLNQVGRRNDQGSVPLILVGEKNNALSTAKTICGIEDLCTLSRDNITSNTLRKAATGILIDKSLIEKLKLKDSDRNRRSFVIAAIKAAELSKELKFKEAKREVLTLFRKYDLEEEDCQREAFGFLRKLVQGYEEYEDMSLDNYLLYLNSIGCTLKPVTRGKVKDFYQNHTYSQLSLCVTITENSSNHRTIHKAKGAEFQNVMLILDSRDEQGRFKEQKDLGFLLQSDLEDEEHRIKYVAISRARERLFINVPSLSPESKELIENVGLEIYNV